MELLFYSNIVSISDWKYTESVGIKIKFSGLVSAVTDTVNEFMMNWQYLLLLFQWGVLILYI